MPNGNPESITSITIALPLDEYNALAKIAKQELRNVSDQAHYFLRETIEGYAFSQIVNKLAKMAGSIDMEEENAN